MIHGIKKKFDIGWGKNKLTPRLNPLCENSATVEIRRKYA